MLLAEPASPSLAPPVAPPPAPAAAPPAPPPRSARRVWSSVAFGAVVLVLFVRGFGPAGGLVFGFLLLTPLELIFRRHDQRVRRPELRADMAHLLFSGLLTTGATIAAIVLWAILLLPWTHGEVPAFFGSQPVVLQAIEAFVLFELMGYVAHRALHEVPQFWRFHQVHHSSRTLDWISGARVHPVEGFIIGAIVAPLLLLVGIRAPALGALTILVNLWGALLHANVRWRLRALDGVWGTPEYHHWHHSNHPEARNKNYSAFLPVLDRLFGTYYQPTDRRPSVYGIDDPLPPTWWGQLKAPFARTRRSSVRPGANPGWKTDGGAPTGGRAGAGPDTGSPVPRPPTRHGATLPDVRFVT